MTCSDDRVVEATLRVAKAIHENTLEHARLTARIDKLLSCILSPPPPPADKPLAEQSPAERKQAEQWDEVIRRRKAARKVRR